MCDDVLQALFTRSFCAEYSTMLDNLVRECMFPPRVRLRGLIPAVKKLSELMQIIFLTLLLYNLGVQPFPRDSMNKEIFAMLDDIRIANKENHLSEWRL